MSPEGAKKVLRPLLMSEGVYRRRVHSKRAVRRAGGQASKCPMGLHAKKALRPPLSEQAGGADMLAWRVLMSSPVHLGRITHQESTTMSSDVIKLRLVNQSADDNNSRVLIFQKNVVANFDELAVAWKVIENLGHGWTHSFDFPLALQVSAEDSYGNSMPLMDTADGQQWTVIRDDSGDQLKQSGQATSPTEVQIVNGLTQGAISANIYRDGKLLATKTGVAPQQQAVFQFKPSIYIGVMSQVQEGEVLDSAIMSTVNQQLNLYGISSADIVMTGGGPGRSATPFTFSLQNIKYL